MSEERPPDSDPAPAGGGVFANLPDARPGTPQPATRLDPCGARQAAAPATAQTRP